MRPAKDRAGSIGRAGRAKAGCVLSPASHCEQVRNIKFPQSKTVSTGTKGENSIKVSAGGMKRAHTIAQQSRHRHALLLCVVTCPSLHHLQTAEHVLGAALGWIRQSKGPIHTQLTYFGGTQIQDTSEDGKCNPKPNRSGKA